MGKGLILTNHGKAQMKRRIGVGKGFARKNAKRAFQKGIAHSETTGVLRSWLNAQYLKEKTATNMRIYKGFLYIFSGEVLVTTYALPEDIRQCLLENLTAEGRAKFIVHTQKPSASDEKAMTEQILKTANEYAEKKEWDFIATSFYKRNSRSGRLYYVSNSGYNDWYWYSELIGYVKSETNISVYLTHVKDRDRHFVTIEEYKKIRK